MISVKDLSVSFGSFDLLSNISFLINNQDRIGLTGKNGAGKSTLLKIIAGLQNPTSGLVEKSKEVTTGYLPQQMKVSDTTSIINETLTAFSEIMKLSDEIDRISREISNRHDYESEEYLKLCDHLTVIEERHRIFGGNNFMGDAEQTLLGLGFERKDFERPTMELSGGWRMRIELAKILLRKPSVFLFDEPTNHLDIESIQWLESFLASTQAAVILVSHDKAFLDNVTNRTLEISLGKIYDYKVSYSKYVELRKERKDQQMAAYRNQQKLIEETEKFIGRFRYQATKAVQVQSKIKQLSKVERIEIDEEDLSALNIRFAPAPRSGSVVVQAVNLSKSYDDFNVLDNIEITIERGQKVAFVGRNGEGKSTLSKIIIGTLEHEGLLKKGQNVKTGYFAQNQDELMNEEKTVFQTIDDVAKGEIRTRIRDLLGSFLFRGEDVDKKVKVLSGGERSRLAMVQLLLEPYNLLVLDEPTNHLDMRSKSILKQALIKYDGTLIVVSHDRDFLDGLVFKVYEFRNKKIKEHIGGIYDFLRRKKLDNLKELEIKDKKLKRSENDNPSENKIRYQEKKEYGKSLRKLQKRLEDTESEIERLEKEILNMGEMLNDESKNGDIDFFRTYQQMKDKLEEEMHNWEIQSLEADKFVQGNKQ
jgi:ATP-binding cassette, subfamily F, member 3